MSEDTTQSLRGLFEGADLNGAQINVITGDHAEVSYQKVGKEEEQPHFPLHGNKDEGMRIYDSLAQESLMQGQQDSWLFFMGFVEQKPLKARKIMWTGTKEQLRVMLRMLNEDSINNKSLSVADMERLTPQIFVDVNNNPLKLAKPKEEISKTMDKLIKIFRPSPTSSETL